MRHKGLLLLLWLAWLLIPGPTAAQTIGSILSGFEVRNITQEPADDFHLVLAGVDCSAVIQTVGPPGWTSTCITLPDGRMVLSWQGVMPLFPGQTGGFGVELAGSPDWRVLCACWTQGGRVLFPMLAWPNQRWNAALGRFVDIVDGYRPLVDPWVTIDRQYTALRGPLELAGLTWDDTAVLPWEPGPGPEPLPADPEVFLDLPIPMSPVDGAVLVRYPVIAPDGMVLARFINQLAVPAMLPGPMYSNFDVVNRTGVCVNDFHLLLEGVGCGMLLPGPQGLYVPPGWTVVCIDTPTGCELRWTRIDGGCVLPGEVVHFGYALVFSPQVRIRAGYWTRDGIPLPPFLDPVIQTWELPGGLVFDRVWGFPPLVEPAGVIFRRDWAALPAGNIPLEQLNRDGTQMLPWQEADPGFISAPPDPAFEAPFVFPELPFVPSALLIRYDVYGAGETLLVSFTNQALPTTVLPPIPPIQDLRIQRVNDTAPDLLHLRLEWTPPASPGLPLQYRIIEYDDPYDPATGETIAYVIDSFFDVFVEIDTAQESPLKGYRVTADYLPPPR